MAHTLIGSIITGIILLVFGLTTTTILCSLWFIFAIAIVW